MDQELSANLNHESIPGLRLIIPKTEAVDSWIVRGSSILDADGTDQNLLTEEPHLDPVTGDITQGIIGAMRDEVSPSKIYVESNLLERPVDDHSGLQIYPEMNNIEEVSSSETVTPDQKADLMWKQVLEISSDLPTEHRQTRDLPIELENRTRTASVFYDRWMTLPKRLQTAPGFFGMLYKETKITRKLAMFPYARDNEKFKCLHCLETFINTISMIRHCYSTHYPFVGKWVCSVDGCNMGAAYKRFSDLQQHVRRMHPADREPTESESKWEARFNGQYVPPKKCAHHLLSPFVFSEAVMEDDDFDVFSHVRPPSLPADINLRNAIVPFSVFGVDYGVGVRIAGQSYTHRPNTQRHKHKYVHLKSAWHKKKPQTAIRSSPTKNGAAKKWKFHESEHVLKRSCSVVLEKVDVPLSGKLSPMYTSNVSAKKQKTVDVASNSKLQGVSNLDELYKRFEIVDQIYDALGESSMIHSFSKNADLQDQRDEVDDFAKEVVKFSCKSLRLIAENTVKQMNQKHDGENEDKLRRLRENYELEINMMKNEISKLKNQLSESGTNSGPQIPNSETEKQLQMERREGEIYREAFLDLASKVATEPWPQVLGIDSAHRVGMALERDPINFTRYKSLPGDEVPAMVKAMMQKHSADNRVDSSGNSTHLHNSPGIAVYSSPSNGPVIVNKLPQM